MISTQATIGHHAGYSVTLLQSLYKAVFLVAANCGMRQTDLSDIRKEDIDLKRGALQKQRHKSDIIRSAMLWRRTIKAIQEMQTKVKNKTEYLFVNSFGDPLSAKAIAKEWRKVRPSGKVQLEHLRDTAATIPIRTGAARLEHVNILMGHNLKGQGNDYVARGPEVTQSAVTSLEQYYFSKKNNFPH